MPRIPGIRIQGVKILKVNRSGKPRELDIEDVTMDDDMRRAINATALEDFGALVALLQLNYGLVTHMGRQRPEFAYHWHEHDGTCHAEDTHDGYPNVAEAICAGIGELLSVERLNGMGPLAMALHQAGIDVTEVLMALNNEEDQVGKVRELTRAIKVAITSMIESGRKQPTGFQGPAVATLLMITREIVVHASADARAALGANQLPIPAALPAGCIAIPAHAILQLEAAMDLIDGNYEGPESNDNRSHVTSSA